jgi:hypothetical protein
VRVGCGFDLEPFATEMGHQILAVGRLCGDHEDDRPSRARGARSVCAYVDPRHRANA